MKDDVGVSMTPAMTRKMKDNDNKEVNTVPDVREQARSAKSEGRGHRVIANGRASKMKKVKNLLNRG